MISIIVITKNEEENIRPCLTSARWADEIVVVDAQSTDATVERAQANGARVFVKPWSGYVDAKAFAVERCRNSWIFWLDADERISPALAEEICRLIPQSPPEAAFRVARKAYFLGRWIKHSGWYPGYVPRLFHRERATFNDAAVHEGLETRGTIGTLTNDLDHFTDPTLHHYFSKLNRYTTLAAQDLDGRKKSFRFSDVMIRPIWFFIRMYFLKLGFLDGKEGFLLAVLSASYVFTKYAKLWEIKRSVTGTNVPQ